MDTSVDRARVGLAGAKTRHGLTEAKLRELQPGDRAYKVSDGGNGLYVVVSPSGSRSFRYDYRLSSRRESVGDAVLRILAGPFGKLNLDEIRPVALGELLDRVKTERGPGPAMHARELVLQVYRSANGKGVDIANPAEALARKAYATFVPRERNLSRHEIKTLLDGLEKTGTAPTLRLAVRFLLLTGVRKGEFIGATWAEVDWERAQWLIPAERMKAGKPHTVYLAEQALDILTTLRTCFPSRSFVHPSRYDSAEPISQATLNRTIAAAVDRINEDRTPDQEPFLPVSVHDLRRTFSSRLNDALFPGALIEACLAHQKKDQVAAAYNHARLSGPRRFLMQVWADMLDCWMRGETAREAIVRGKTKIDAAAHDAEGMNL